MKIFTILVSSFFIAQLSSHGGGLDRYGCHNETKTGGYHCHRSSGLSGLSSGSGLNSYSSSSLDTLKMSWDDEEFFDGEIKIKNFGCYAMSGLKMEIINKSDKNYRINFKIIMKDNEKDPLFNWTNSVNVNSMSRSATLYIASGDNLLSVINNKCPKDLSYRSIQRFTRTEI